MRFKSLSRLILIGIGLLLGLFAILAPSLKIIGVRAFSVAQILLLGLALMLVMVGLTDEQKIGPRLKSIYQAVALMLLNTFALLILIESIALIGWNAFVRTIPQDQLVGLARDLPYYQGVPWGEQ